jgi:2-keto-4-pentenoate hydratase
MERTMDRQQISHAAALLAGARRTGQLLDSLPADATPANIAEGHAIQDAVTATLGRPVGAYKAMAPAHGEPTRGVIYADTIHPSPARIPAAAVPQCGVEGEVAFVFLRDLPPRPAAYSRDEVSDAVEACAAIELVSSRYRNSDTASNLQKLADNISNGAFVHAAPAVGWRALELGQLKVTLTVNGSTVLEQAGGHATGDPLGIAVALANMMREQHGVRAGQFVTCGTYTGLRYLKPGDVCGVRFEGLGAAEVTFDR